MALTSSKFEESWKGHSEEKEEIEGFMYYRSGKVSHSVLPFELELRVMNVLAKRIREVIEIEKPDILN